MPLPREKLNLTDAVIKRVIKPDGTRRNFWDALMPNLLLQVSAHGKASFYIVRRQQPTDKNVSWFSLGRYPVVSLAQAREKAREVLTTLQAGEDPRALAAAKRRAEEESKAARAETFAAVAERYLRHLAIGDNPPRASTVRVYRGYLNNWLFPALGERPITTITRKHIMATLDMMRERAGVASVIGAKSLLTAIFNYAAVREIVASSPVAGIPTKEVTGRAALARSRVLTDAELAAVWAALPAVGGPFVDIYRLLLLTGLRLNEVAGLKWEEIDLDKLNIPGERSKNGLAMVVPLPPLACEIIHNIKKFDGPFVFTTTFGRRPVSASSHAKARLDAALKAAGAEMPDFVVHDFRRVVRTGLTALGVTEDVGEAVLNHKKRGIRATYDKHEFYDEKAAALRAWETRLRSVVGLAPRPDGNVLPLRATP
jgi:integrase